MKCEKMKNQKIFFIIYLKNLKKINRVKSEIHKFFKHRNEAIFVYESKFKGHSIELTKEAVENNASSIIACGGDGTINEISSVLVKSSVSLGIIPLGSGNGIAKHFNIPKKINLCLLKIVKNKTTLIDIGKVNNYFFVGNMGVGFESDFIKEYSKSQGHGFLSYLKSFIIAIVKFSPSKFEIKINQKSKKLIPFMLIVSNVNQQGYNFTVTPNALANDGLLNLVWLKNASVLKILKLISYTFFKIKLNPNFLNSTLVDKIKITKLSNQNFYIQIDGESILINNSKLIISTIKNGIKLII
tara:strand:+ start:287 stop:1183 length:897 start_codon:yes stop_codon:yes gene_type:complete